MPRALERVHPSVTRNELGWLATLDDVESRLIFVDRSGGTAHYRAETGPFTPEYLAALPKSNWTLLVHDVEKHVPALRALFQHVPFIADWRIDDLMVSFAAPGGGVGPHRDHYDVFLCQGIGVREWRFSTADIENDPAASSDLALLSEFDAESVHSSVQGDVLYLPPGCAHWGVAKRACMTYSIGMRAPQANDILFSLGTATSDLNPFYADPDAHLREARPGWISDEAIARASHLIKKAGSDVDVARALGQFATRPKEWLTPETLTDKEARQVAARLRPGATLKVHGMSQVAFDPWHVHSNGKSFDLPATNAALVGTICAERRAKRRDFSNAGGEKLLIWLLRRGTFEIPEKL